MAFQDLTVHGDSLRNACLQMDEVATELDSLRALIENNAHLPPLTFGSIGEGARINYETGRGNELANLSTGVATARTFADNLHRSGTHYLSAEDANVRTVLRDIGWLPGGGGARTPQAAGPLPTAKGSPTDFVVVPAAAEVLGAGALTITALGTATAANLKACRGWTVLAAGVAIAWGAVVWADDSAVNSAVQTWDEVARRARALFGSDVTAVGQALKDTWHGTAAGSADARIMAFVVAGMALADRAEARVATLRELIEEVTVIHRFAFVVSALMVITAVASLVAVGVAATAVYAGYLIWAVCAIEILLTSFGVIAMWDQSENGFINGDESGSAARAEAALTPPYPQKMRMTPPSFTF